MPTGEQEVSIGISKAAAGDGTSRTWNRRCGLTNSVVTPVLLFFLSCLFFLFSYHFEEKEWGLLFYVGYCPSWELLCDCLLYFLCLSQCMKDKYDCPFLAFCNGRYFLIALMLKQIFVSLFYYFFPVLFWFDFLILRRSYYQYLKRRYNDCLFPIITLGNEIRLCVIDITVSIMIIKNSIHCH